MQTVVNWKGTSLSTLAVVGVLAVASVVMGILLNVAGSIGIVIALVVLIAGIVWGAGALRSHNRALESYTGWIPVAWLALFLVSNHSFDNRSPLAAAQGSASGRVLIEVAVYALIALTVIMRWSLTPVGLPSLSGWLVLAAWPAFALYSTFWSLIPLFSVVRSAQLFVPILLALYVARIWKAWPEVGREIWFKTLRLLIRVTTLLAIVGFIFVNQWLGEGNSLRFAWPGVHPVEGGMLLGMVLIVVIVGGRQLTNSSKLVHTARVILLGAALALTQTRGALVSFVAAGLVAVWFAGRRQVLFRYAALPLIVVGSWALWTLSRTSLIDYTLRGGGTDVVTTFNGRIPLWTLAVDLVHSAGRDLMGFGYGAPRVLLFERVEWAGSAHNAWIELYVGLGLVGVFLAFLGYAFVGSRLLKILRIHSGRTAVAVLSLFVFLLVSSIDAELAALPGFGYALLLLVATYVVAESDRVVLRHASRSFALPQRVPTTY